MVLGRLLEQAAIGRRPESGASVADLLAQYMAVAELDPSTRETYEGYIRRTILPAFGCNGTAEASQASSGSSLMASGYACA
jgi:hypothetical protein